MKEQIKLYMELTKFRITFAVTLSTITGYILMKHGVDWNAILPTLGVFFLAAASAALNQYQERKFDAAMDRTKNRPIPSGRISEKAALTFIVLVTLMGSAMIYFASNLTAMLLGWLTFFWYNAIYTPLKRKTVFAVIVGALIGALPPMIGYAAAGGHWLSLEILIVAFFFFIWQVPHFILLVLRFGSDYEKAGYPSLTETFSDYQIKRIIFIWIVGTVFSAFLMLVFNVVENQILSYLLLLFSLSLIVTSGPLLRKDQLSFKFMRVFMNINIYLLIIMIILVIESVV